MKWIFLYILFVQKKGHCLKFLHEKMNLTRQSAIILTQCPYLVLFVCELWSINRTMMTNYGSDYPIHQRKRDDNQWIPNNLPSQKAGFDFNTKLRDSNQYHWDNNLLGFGDKGVPSLFTVLQCPSPRRRKKAIEATEVEELAMEDLDPSRNYGSRAGRRDHGARRVPRPLPGRHFSEWILPPYLNALRHGTRPIPCALARGFVQFCH